MKEFVGYALSVFFGFFAIMNPIANTPIFLGLTANETSEDDASPASCERPQFRS